MVEECRHTSACLTHVLASRFDDLGVGRWQVLVVPGVVEVQQLLLKLRVVAVHLAEGHVGGVQLGLVQRLAVGGRVASAGVMH